MEKKWKKKEKKNETKTKTTQIRNEGTLPGGWQKPTNYSYVCMYSYILIAHPPQAKEACLADIRFWHHTTNLLGRFQRNGDIRTCVIFTSFPSDPSIPPPYLISHGCISLLYCCTSQGLCRSLSMIPVSQSACHVLYCGISFTPMAKASSRSCMHIP